MKRTGILTLLLLLGLVIPGTSQARPAGPYTNPLGTLQWLPDYASEKPRPDTHRLVVVYDWSMNQAGKPSGLLAKGAFAVKVATTSPELRMVDHSPGVQVLGLPPVTNAVDQYVMALEGDVRDGSCALAGEPGFSEAYSYTRTFMHDGSQTYTPTQGPGICEELVSSIRQGNGFLTKVTTHVPGFWIDVAWPKRNGGRVLPQVWYEALYDSQRDDGSNLLTVNAAGASSNVSEPPS